MTHTLTVLADYSQLNVFFFRLSTMFWPSSQINLKNRVNIMNEEKIRIISNKSPLDTKNIYPERNPSMVSVEIIAIDKAPSCDWITIFPLYQNFNRFVSILAYKHAHTHTTEWGLLSLLVRSLSHFTWVEFLFVCDSYVVYVSISCALSLSFHLSRDFSRVLVSTDKYTDYAHTIRPIDWEKWREEKNPFDWNDDSPFFSLTNCLNLAKKNRYFLFCLAMFICLKNRDRNTVTRHKKRAETVWEAILSLY